MQLFSHRYVDIKAQLAPNNMVKTVSVGALDVLELHAGSLKSCGGHITRRKH